MQFKFDEASKSFVYTEDGKTWMTLDAPGQQLAAELFARQAKIDKLKAMVASLTAV